MNVSAKITGLPGLQAKLKKLDPAGHAMMVDGLKHAAIAVHKEALDSMKKSGGGRTYKRRGVFHTASLPFHPPAVDTGKLWSSVKWEIDERKLVAQVGTNVEYGAALEVGTSHVLPRPWLLPALRKVQGSISKMVKAAILRKEIK